MTGATLVGGAGLGLAQDQNLLQSPPSVQNDTGPVEPLNQLDIPPAEEAPTVAEAPPPPAPVTPSANTTANTVAELPPPPPPPPKRPRYTSVVLQTLDKVTAETLRFEAKVDEPVRYKDLVITVHACETAATDEPYAQTAAHMDVQYQPEVLGGRTPQVARQVFRGWMYGDAPGLHPFEHPIYDLWVIACKTAPAPATPPSTPAPTGASL
ncbi:DUF2155 domain-containing protein [Caulobacter sp. S45]|uniref:DUF2155 domain-containing protein n=1 Tax=Caulobacter sp. S45 TaxID=1641861 RepID=UPI0020C69058|nr:DUF2155 domain-containing protein [Caulobacter sp. S45]